MAHVKTSYWGIIGESLKTVAPLTPMPFNLIPLLLGHFCSAVAFHMAADKDNVVTLPANPPVEIDPSVKP